MKEELRTASHLKDLILFRCSLISAQPLTGLDTALSESTVTISALLFLHSGYSSILKMEAAGSFQPPIYSYQTTQHHIPEDSEVYKTTLKKTHSKGSNKNKNGL